MSKPAHKEDEDIVSSGSDTESESEEDEDTVSHRFNLFSLLIYLKYSNSAAAIILMDNYTQISTYYVFIYILSILGLNRKSESSSLYDQSIFAQGYAWYG